MEPGLLLIPGPVPLHPRVQAEMAKPALPHYGDAWVKTYRETQDLLRYVWQAPAARVFPIVGPGHAGMEVIAHTFLRPRDRIVVLDNGFFGGRFEEVLRAHSIKVDAIRSDWGREVDLAGLRQALRTPAKAVAVVHNETSTGVANALEGIAEVARAADAFVFTDAVSSLAGLPLPFERLGLDAGFSASQKCLAGPAGIAPIAVSRRLWESVKPEDVQGWYFNLFTWDKYDREWGEWHPTPTTVSSNVFYAFAASLRVVKEEGLEPRFARHARAAERLRKGLEALGFRLFAPAPLRSDTVTCAYPPKGTDATAFVRDLREKRGIYISGGLGPLRGKTVRIGTMGTQAEPDVVDAFLEAAKAVL